MDNEFAIYFSDLNPAAQEALMRVVGIDDPSEMNWDVDMCPLAYYPIPYDDEEI